MDVAVPLISAAVAALVAWIVTLRQGRTARENWVLDKRYLLYERTLNAGLAFTGLDARQTRTRLKDRQFTGALEEAITILMLLAPRWIRVHAAHVVAN